MKKLHPTEKRLHWEIIKAANNDGITVYKGPFNNLRILIRKELVIVNRLYNGEGVSLIVLPTSPTLIRKLRSL